MSIRYTAKQIQSKLSQKYNGNIVLIENTYINNTTLSTFYCNLHGINYERTPSQVLSTNVKYSCPECLLDHKKTYKSKGFKYYYKKAIAIHGTSYTYFKETYKKASTPLKIYCKKHNNYFWQTFNSHINNLSIGCKGCIKDNSEQPTREKLDKFLYKAHKVYGNKYDYSLIKAYRNGNQEIEVICPTHGIFKVVAKRHLSKNQKQGCPKCLKEIKSLDIINKAKLYHKNKYNYSLIPIPFNTKDKVKIVCRDCGEVFSTSMNSHTAKKTPRGCSNCLRKYKENKSTFDIEELVLELNKIHENKYFYPKIPINLRVRDKIEIICPYHGSFFQNISAHRRGHGCKKCATRKVGDILKIDKEELIKQSKKRFGNKFDYSRIGKVSNKSSKVTFYCIKCSIEFRTTWNVHINSIHGCPSCAGNIPKSLDELLLKIKEKYGDRYDLSLVNTYKNIRQNIDIKCNSCDTLFSTTWNSFINLGVGCPDCKVISIQEEYIKKVLKENDIAFTRQFIFDNCRDSYPLRFDFAIFDKSYKLNFLLEYDGKQHFQIIDYFNGEIGFIERKKKDAIKNSYCTNNNIDLLRISYHDKSTLQEILEVNLMQRGLI